MFDELCRSRIKTLLDAATIAIDGHHPWDIHVHDSRMFRTTVLHGSIGFGEAYMAGWWDCEDIDELFFRLLSYRVNQRLLTLAGIRNSILSIVRNLQKPQRAFMVGKYHYDVGNDLFRAILDPQMIYSCAFWQNTVNLDRAQQLKLHLVFDKLDLKPGMTLLDIGCGWGGTARFAAEQYGASVVGITISKEQAQIAKTLCKHCDVDIRLMDYRSVVGVFDRIVSIGMIEHVGHKNYRTFFDVASRCLKPDGRLLLQSIGSNIPSTCTDPWVEKYIFPNSMLPAASQLARSWEGRFILEDWHSFGHDYACTLKAWDQKLTGNRAGLEAHYDETFFRMWRYYLLSCSGAFRARAIQLWQILLSPGGIKGKCRIPHEPFRRKTFRRAYNRWQWQRKVQAIHSQPRQSRRSGTASQS
jgi:cyclopropane-fatty-acyl-phospholipid synthase